MAEVVKRQTGQTEVERVRMTLLDEQDIPQQRELVAAIRREDGGRLSYMVRFLAPKEIRGVALLALEQPGGLPTKQYLYLPALGAMREISGDQRGGYFMGSDFTFDDLRRENMEEQQYSRLRDDELNGETVYVVQAAPKSVDLMYEVGYSRRLIYVDKEDFSIVQIEFFEEGTEGPIKTFEGMGYREVSDEGDATYRPRRVIMNNHQRNTSSILTLLDSEVDVTLPDSIFDPKSLSDWSPEEKDPLLKLLEDDSTGDS